MNSANPPSNLPANPAPNGIVTVDKPQGITSHGVVARLRRALGLKKIGHAGTLDPMATGLIVAGVGPMTRLLTYLVGLDKVYLATMRLGASSSTEDAEGDIVIDSQAIAARAAGHSLSEQLGLTPDALQTAITQLTGDIDQVPSAVSAIKVDGKRAYQRVRDGEQVQLKSRPVTIYEFTLLSTESLDSTEGVFLDVQVRVHCSSGTYIRALARDLGASLGVGAHLTQLRRIAVGPFRIDQASQLDAVSADSVAGGAELARALFDSLELDETEVQKLLYGQKLRYDDAMQTRIMSSPTAIKNTPIAACFGDQLIAMLRIQGQGLHPETVFGR